MRYETRNERPIDPPDPGPLPLCPVCGEECETVYTDSTNEVVGCDVCLEARDAYDFLVNE